MSTGDATSHDPRPDLAEEATRLADALQGWWASTIAPAAGRSTRTPQHDETTQRERAQHDPTQHDPTQHDPTQHDPTQHSQAQDDAAQHGGPSCRSCPLCRALDVVRGLRPELLEQVASAAETVAVLLREAARDVRTSATGDARPGADLGEEPPADEDPADEPPADEDPADEGPADEGWGDDPLAPGTPIAVTDDDLTDDADDGDVDEPAAEPAAGQLAGGCG